ncbi:10837_t:CDS:2, partial [Entrophospora sp. SA101]
PARNGFEQLELELVEWLSENNGGRIGKTAVHNISYHFVHESICSMEIPYYSSNLSKSLFFLCLKEPPTKYAAWVNQYGWAVYDAGMDILATHNLGTNSRRYKDLYNLRDIIHTGNLAPNGWSNW